MNPPRPQDTSAYSDYVQSMYVVGFTNNCSPSRRSAILQKDEFVETKDERHTHQYHRHHKHYEYNDGVPWEGAGELGSYGLSRCLHEKMASLSTGAEQNPAHTAPGSGL